MFQKLQQNVAFRFLQKWGQMMGGKGVYIMNGTRKISRAAYLI